MAYKKDKNKKHRFIRWKGLLADWNLSLRLVAVGVFAAMCASLAFTQFGFAGISLPDKPDAYAVVLLLPVALTALLLGTLFATGMGFFAGLMLYVHAMTLPFNYYELTFVAPQTSMFMIALCGFLLGIGFAFVLRNNPRGIKRIIYITLVCILVSWFYSFGFTVHVISDLFSELVAGSNGAAGDSEVERAAREAAAPIALRMGDIGLQAWVDALLMALVCVVCDLFVSHHRKKARVVGLHQLFGRWLSVVVLVAFMIISSASFVALTNAELIEASKSMRSQASYFATQLKAQENRSDALQRFIQAVDFESQKLNGQSYDDLASALSIDNLLDDYNTDGNGAIIVSYDVDAFDSALENLDPNSATAEDYEKTFKKMDEEEFWNQRTGPSVVSNSVITMSDDGRFTKDERLGEFFDDDVFVAISRSLETGEMQRIVDDGMRTAGVDFESLRDRNIESQLSYVFCMREGTYLITILEPSSEVFADRGGILAWTASSSLVLLLAVFAAIFLLLHFVVIKRIDNINKTLASITEGDLRKRVATREVREFNELSTGINQTVDALQGWIHEAESRIDTELSTAKNIQEAALPRTFPPFPDNEHFDIYASMKAAREVGGDFYDFFLIEDADGTRNKLGFVIADVSGKGVPASLFMMKSMTQIRDYLASGIEVGEAVENANRQLCSGNDAGMFVTVWVGVLSYETGHVDFVNAGHNPPLLWQKGAWRFLSEKSGLPLGLFESASYKSFSLECDIGDEFLLYTDGVTEAMNPQGDLYGEKRLEEFSAQNFALHPRQLVETLRVDVARYSDGAEQSDDITLLALEVGVPPEITASLTVPARDTELARVNAFIHTELDRRLCPVRVQNQIDIAVEEMFINVCHYAYPEATEENPGSVNISYTYSADPPSVEISLTDSGIPYNPLEKADAVTPDNIEDVPIGGLGILMAKHSVDEMDYKREEDRNIVMLIKRW